MVDSVVDMFSSSAMVLIAGAIICAKLASVKIPGLKAVTTLPVEYSVTAQAGSYRRDHDAKEACSRNGRRDTPFQLGLPVEGILSVIWAECHEVCIRIIRDSFFPNVNIVPALGDRACVLLLKVAVPRDLCANLLVMLWPLCEGLLSLRLHDKFHSKSYTSDVDVGSQDTCAGGKLPGMARRLYLLGIERLMRV